MALAVLFGLLAAGAWRIHVLSNQPRPGPLPPRGVRLLTQDRPFPAEGRYPSDPYIGPHVCAECHPGETSLYVRSGHGRTLWTAGRRALARVLDGQSVQDPEHSDTVWSYRYHDGDLFIRRRVADKMEEAVAEYAFGSGHHATTFVSVIDPKAPMILEHRITYFGTEHALGITPGHDARPRPPGLTPIGGVLDPRDARKCFGCHATDLSAHDGTVIDEATMIPNVSCERCHGPARAHVEAARRNAPDAELAMPLGPDRYTAQELIMFCANCHRRPSHEGEAALRPENPLLARFQPIGVLQSPCFRESAGAFSCVTCHDPHARSSSDRAAYDKICLKCHDGSGPPAPGALPGPAALGTPRAGVECPVVPRGRCIECHMPKVDAGQHILFSDHWIRPHRPDGPAPLSGPAPIWKKLDTPRP